MIISRSLINESYLDKISFKNKIHYIRYIKLLFGLNKDTEIEAFLETYATEEYENEIQRCNFCGKFKKMKEFSFTLNKDTLEIKILSYQVDKNICSKRKDTKDCASKTLNHNSTQYIATLHNVSNEEALHIIHTRNSSPFYRINHKSDEEYSLSQKRDKKWFEENNLNFDLSNSKRKFSCSKDGYISKYGEEEGTKRWKENNKRKDNSSLNYFISKYGEEEGTKKYKIKIEKCKQTLENMIKRYGEEEGKLKYQKSNIQKGVSQTLQGMIERYGKEEGIKRWNILSKKQSYTKSKKYYLDTYGEKLGKEKWNETCKSKANTLENMIKRYGEEEGTKKYLKYQINNKVKFSRASKASLRNVFVKLYKHLRKDYNIPRNDIYFGFGSSKEFFILDDNNKMLLYDFTIRSLKIIVEYHGSLWHYNPKCNYSLLQLPYNRTIDDYKIKDKYKKNNAIQNGFEYFEIFDTDNFDFKINEILLKVKEKING